MSTKDDPLKALIDLVHEPEIGTGVARARQSESTWRGRIEQAAEALADVLPGEVGRLDLLARISELKRQRDAAVADLASILNAWSTGEHGVAVVLEGLCSAKPGHPGAALLEQHRKALVRARNEGLEVAAAVADQYNQSARAHRANMETSVMRTAWDQAAGTASDIAASIRAMKEPEQ